MEGTVWVSAVLYGKINGMKNKNAKDFMTQEGMRVCPKKITIKPHFKIFEIEKNDRQTR